MQCATIATDRRKIRCLVQVVACWQTRRVCKGNRQRREKSLGWLWNAEKYENMYLRKNRMYVCMPAFGPVTATRTGIHNFAILLLWAWVQMCVRAFVWAKLCGAEWWTVAASKGGCTIYFMKCINTRKSATSSRCSTNCQQPAAATSQQQSSQISLVQN